jgi:exodeoxyribonuclease III
MKILEWNIRHGGSRTQALASAIVAHDPDVVVLCEYREKTRELLDDLRLFGWVYAISSPVSGCTNGVAIVSRLSLTPRASPLGEPPFAWWAVEADVPGGLSVIGVYAPLQNSFASSPAIQRQFWAAVHEMIVRRQKDRVLLIGDFNTGATRTDCPVAVPCGDAFEQLSALGWVDAWRWCNPDASDFSYVHDLAGTPANWRIDHAFVSPPLSRSLMRCWYSHAERECWASDHSMLLLDLRLT